MRKRSVPCLMVIPALAVAGCGGAKQGTQAASQTTEHKAAPTGLGQPKAKVSFVTPKNGGTTPCTVMAKVDVSGIKLAPQAVNQPAKLGQGHLHFSMDEGKYDYARYSGPNGKLAAKLGVQGKYSPSVTPVIVYHHLPPGKHELEVYVANNDHTNTGAEDKIEFTVKK
jgi:hypothetical protein